MISGGGGYNSLTVIREPYAPVDPVFAATAPRLLPVRVNMRGIRHPVARSQPFRSMPSASVSASPTNLTVYYRSQAGQGIFLPQPTAYNPVTHQLLTTLTMNSTGGDLGEFVFGYPDLADVPFAPLLAEVENYRGVQTHEVVAPKLAATGTVYSVNQQLPISALVVAEGLGPLVRSADCDQCRFHEPAVGRAL